jgi:integrase
LKADHLQNEKRIKVSGRLYEHNGIYQMGFSWMEPDGERGRKSKSTGLPVKGNKKRAEGMLNTERKELEEQLYARRSSDDILFADFMEGWLEVIKPKVKLTTFGGYQLNVQKAIAPHFRGLGTLLRELTAEDVQEFYDIQLKDKKATTIHKYHGNISKALKYAVKKGLVPHSIMETVERPKPERFVGKFLKQSEAIALFDAVKDTKLELGVILGAFYGLRRAEIVGLRWESIDFEANAITIEHTVTEAYVDGKRIIVAGDTTKTKSSYRSLPLIPEFRAKLLAVREEQERNRKLCSKSYNKADAQYVYTDVLGNRIKPGYLSSAFHEFLETRGLKRMRFHDLRHSCASLLLANGVSLKQIQEWLGHSNFTITADIYAHLDFNSKLESAQAMTWLDKTAFAMGQEIKQLSAGSTETEKETDTSELSPHSLPNFINSLFASGVTIDIVQAWLKQADLSNAKNYAEDFKAFKEKLPAA